MRPRAAEQRNFTRTVVVADDLAGMKFRPVARHIEPVAEEKHRLGVLRRDRDDLAVQLAFELADVKFAVLPERPRLEYDLIQMETGFAEVADALPGREPVPADIAEDAGMEHAVDRQRRNPVEPHDFRLRKAGAYSAVESDGGRAVQGRKRFPVRAGKFRFKPEEQKIVRSIAGCELFKIGVVERQAELPDQHPVLPQPERRKFSDGALRAVRPDELQRQADLPVAFAVRSEQRESGRPPFPAQDFGTVGHLKHPASAVAVRVDHRGEAFAGHLERRGRKQVHKQAEYRKENVFHREASVQNWRGQ